MPEVLHYFDSLSQVPRKHSRTVLANSDPRTHAARKFHFLVLVGLDCGVYGQGVQSVHCGIVDGTDDPGWAEDVPADAVSLAIVVNQIFLWVVEVRLCGVDQSSKTQPWNKRWCSQ